MARLDWNPADLNRVDPFCMCCGRPAIATPQNQGYSECCNDRITTDPAEHPDVVDPDGR
jgi:hypothetical protein